jgi:hypothetical protein
LASVIWLNCAKRTQCPSSKMPVGQAKRFDVSTDGDGTACTKHACHCEAKICARPKLHSCYASQFAAKPLAIALSLILLAVAHSEALWTCWVVCSTMGMADRSAASGSNSYRAQEKGRKNNPWSFREKTTVGKAKRLRCAFVKRSNSYPRYSSIKLIDLCPAYYKHVVLKTRPVTTYGSQLLEGRRSSK